MSALQRNVLTRDVSRASSTLLMSDDYEESEYEYNSDDEGDGSAVVSAPMDAAVPAGKGAATRGRVTETQFLDQARLEKFLVARLNDFVEITCASLGEAARYLQAHHWQLQDATTAYFVSPEREATGADVAETKGMCMICAEDDVKLSGVGCGDVFCDECWTSYIRQKVAGEGTALFIPCMGFKCTRVLGIDMVRGIVAKVSDGPDEEEECGVLSIAEVDAAAATPTEAATEAKEKNELGPTVGTAQSARNSGGIGRVGLRLLRGITGRAKDAKDDESSSHASPASNLSTPPDAASIKQLFERLVINDLVTSYPRLRFCQSPSCGLAALVRDQTEPRVDCTCGSSFCFSCGNESHIPATCATLRTWASKEVGEGETFNWIAANTKDCPSCQSPIEKNHGCNHMTCTKCRHEFCWLCLAKYSNHSSCNAYASEKAETTASEAREAIKRYNHYWTRYNVHRQAQQLEDNMRVRTQRNINDMFAEQRKLAGQDLTVRAHVLKAQNEAGEKKKMKAAGDDEDSDDDDGSDVGDMATVVAAVAAAAGAPTPPELVSLDVLASTWNILEEATENLINCRRVLRFTYIHAYFLKVGSNELHLFEFLQAELEASTERLSHLLETKSTQKLLSDRQEIKQSSFDAGGRLKNLVDGVASGGFTVDVAVEVAPTTGTGADNADANASPSGGTGGGRSVLRSMANALRGTSR
jgi:hypothetical protein